MKTRKRNNRGELIGAALNRYLPPEGEHPAEIHEAMRYAVFSGGKRFRPQLVLAACEAVGGNPRKALLAACAVEFVHSYSLVHDDLPALDNDEWRRGKPTCHRRFGEALAILAGDALLTQAFRILAEHKPVAKANSLVRELSEAAGTRGMVGGQVADILLSKNGSGLDLSKLDYISRNKTGRLIEASTVMGALVGTGSSSKLRRIRKFGRALGLAFQVVDDIMDGDGYLRRLQPEEAHEKAQSLIKKAKQEVAPFGRRAKRLLELADFLSHVEVGVKN